MENGIPASSGAATIGHHRNSTTSGGSTNNFAAAAAAALAAAAAASQHHFFNAAMRAVTAAPSSVGADRGSGTSDSPLSVHLDYAPEAAEAKLIDYRHEKVAAFEIDGETMMCLPQAYELFLKNLVGGLHTVYTKLKRLEIAPFVCNVEQVRALRSIGAIQPGVNRCKLISCRDFDVLFEDCASSSSRPGRPPKRSPVFTASSSTLPPSSVLSSASSSISANNGYAISGTLGGGFCGGGSSAAASADIVPPTKRSRANETSAASALDKFNTTFNPMAGFMNTAAAAAASAGGNALNSNQLFPMFPFVPQNLMFSHFINAANPNATLLAKHWGEQLNAFSSSNASMENSSPLDATTTAKDNGIHSEFAAGIPSSVVAGSRIDRNLSLASNSGRESDEFIIKSSNGETFRESRSLSLADNVLLNASIDRQQSDDDNDEGSNSDFNDANPSNHSPTEEDLRVKERETVEKDDQQSCEWTNTSIANAAAAAAAGGTEASQLLRSMDLGVSSQYFGGPQGLAAVAAAAAAASASHQNSRRQCAAGPKTGLQQGDSSHNSSVDNILFSVLGLVQIAASTARFQEEQLVKDKLEAMKTYENEKRERMRLEQILLAERRSKAVYLKRLRKERKQKVELTEKMALLVKAGKQHAPLTNVNLSSGGSLFPDTTTARPTNLSQRKRSTTSSSETSPPCFPPKTAAMLWYPELVAERSQQGPTRDGDQQEDRSDGHVAPLQFSDTSGAVEGTERKGSTGIIPAADNDCGEGSRNERGRTATLLIKHEFA